MGKSEPNRDEPVPAARPFAEIDVEKIKKDLNLVREGEARGKKDIPPTPSEAPDDIEYKIITTMEAEFKRQQQIMNEQMGVYQQRISKLDLAHEAINIAATAQRASTEFIVKVDDGKAKLFTLWRNFCMIEDQWNEFRTKNRLAHPADYPISKLWNFAIILVILMVESILNGTFLARGLETGLIGGVIEAFVIAAVNVGFGFFLGDSIMRYAFHRNYLLRFVTFIEVPISCGIAITFNLLVGHYRDALGGADPMHASSAAIDSFLAHPLQLAALESWILFCVGIFFCLVAAVDGFKMDDPYPGYGKISRKHEEIMREYTDEKANIIDDLSHTRDQALDYIREARQNLSTRRTELAHILDLRQKLIQYFDVHQNYLNRAANDLLSTYRSANMQARTSPPPAHFNNSYAVYKSTADTPTAFISNEKLMDDNVDKTDEALQQAISQVNTKFEEAVREFHQISDLASKGKHAIQPAKT
jgi:hypothetical protein